MCHIFPVRCAAEFFLFWSRLLESLLLSLSSPLLVSAFELLLLLQQHPVQSRLDRLVPLRVVEQLRLLCLHFFKMSHRASEVTDSSTQPPSVKLSDAALMRDWMSNKYKLSSLCTWSFDFFSLGSLRGPPASQAPVMARAIKHRSSSSLARGRNFKLPVALGRLEWCQTEETALCPVPSHPVTPPMWGPRVRAPE